MKKSLLTIILASLILALIACTSNTTSQTLDKPIEKSPGKIYLYGEQHGIEKILQKELELWSKYYHEEGMRHLFVELPYYTAEFLNLWMEADGDDILTQVYEDWQGTAIYNPAVKAFYQSIKSECPETIFHGTDVGHQYATTGQRFLQYLKDNNLENTQQFTLAQEAIEQGKHYYRKNDDVYRENKMVENFIREFDKLKDADVMGIYGGAHTDPNALDYMTQSIPCMAKQLKERYGEAIYTEDLSWLARDIEPSRIDTFTINNKDYEASYFGKQDLNGFHGYAHREFWRLENAYDDFKNNEKTGDVLPYDNYPMLLEAGQVFVIDYTKTDGSVERKYYRSDGYVWNGSPATEEFIIE